MDSLTLTYIILGSAGVIGFSCFAVLILAPAWSAYGRTWERLAAAVLSLFILAAFAGTGVVIGLIVLWNWDQILEFLRINALLCPFL